MPARTESPASRRAAPDPSASSARSDATLKTQAYARLKAMILAGELRPGQKLAERELAAALDVSRTPVREALGRLAQEGLVEARPQRGHVVRAVDVKSVEDIYDLREVLELEAIRLAMQRMDKADMAAFDALARSLARFSGAEQSEAELREGQKLHEMLARASRNELLHEMLLRLYDRLQLFVWIDALYADEAARTRAEHADIIDAIRRGDVEDVQRRMAQHLRRSKSNVLRALRARPALAGG